MTESPYHYTVYGLHLISDQPLPEVLPVDPDSAGKSVYLNRVQDCDSLPMRFPTDQDPWYSHPYLDENGISALRVWRDDDYYYLRYLNGNQFVVNRAGDAVWIVWPEESNLGFVLAQLLGPVCGLVLRLHNLLVLHASVVVSNGQALAVLGGTGAGKSTTAAELCRQGSSALSDDIAALTEKDGTWWVQPGYPRLRLWPSSAEALYGPDHNLRAIAPGHHRWNKRYLDAEGGQVQFSVRPQALRAIYALNWKETNGEARIKKMSGIQALAMVDANTFMNYLLDQKQRTRQIAAIASLLDSVVVCQVQPVADLMNLPALGRAILEDFVELGIGGENAAVLDDTFQ